MLDNIVSRNANDGCMLELPSMIATLFSYENLFGPYHPQTLALATKVAICWWHAGEPACARSLLERVVRDLAQHLGREHDLRLRAVAALRDLLVAQRDYRSHPARTVGMSDSTAGQGTPRDDCNARQSRDNPDGELGCKCFAMQLTKAPRPSKTAVLAQASLISVPFSTG
jgi:hypothetical protein